MRRRPWLAGLAPAVAMAMFSSSANAGGFLFHRHDAHCEHHERPHPTPEPGAKRHICHTHERVGFPLLLRNHLEPTNAGDSYGYYVGGGGGHGSESRCREEGTYGWDYTGIHFPRRVALGWNHGRKSQGGTGRYQTDGPFEVPNVFAIEHPKVLHHAEGGEGEH